MRILYSYLKYRTKEIIEKLFLLTVFIVLINNITAKQFMWISGSDSPNSAGSYGSQGVPNPSNVPGARRGAVSWTDPENNLWLFGGEGYATSTTIGI